MKISPGPGAHVQLLLLLPLTMAAAGVGFSRSHQAGCLALGLCALFALVLGQRLEALPDHGGLVPGPGPDSPRGVRRGPGCL